MWCWASSVRYRKSPKGWDYCFFGTVGAVGSFARGVLGTLAGDPVLAQPETLRRFIRPSGIPGGSRAIGWDTMLPTSSCGTRLSDRALGHTGFTGTSLWIDPGLDRYFVLLTNRVAGAATVEAMQTVRRSFHDALARL